MQKYLLFLIIALIFAGCANEKKEIYDKAVEYTKKQLKSPSSAKFQPYDKSKVIIKLNAGKDSPMLNGRNMEVYNNLDPKVQDKMKKEYRYDEASIYGEYEAQNSYGVYLTGKYFVIFHRYLDGYCNGKCDWEIYDATIE